MKSFSTVFSPHKSRVGFHYYPDTIHYQKTDLDTWLPELTGLDTSWLVLRAPEDRAIPEFFIKGLLDAGIEPLLQFNLAPSAQPSTADLKPLLAAYAHWGITGIILNDRPNSRSTWNSPSWTQKDLVERFLDNYLPAANLALQSGLIPIVPPLEPGGNYWDTAFLRAFLEGLNRRKQDRILQNLVLSAYGWTAQRSLNWGAGGPERWPEARPYFTPSEAQDQIGFRIFDWYSAICQAIIGKTAPIILLGAGLPENPYSTPLQITIPEQQAAVNLAITKLLMDQPAKDPQTEDADLLPIPAEVIACNFWLLTADVSSPYYKQAWFLKDNVKSPSVIAVRKWLSEPRQAKNEALTQPVKSPPMRKDFYRKVTRPAGARPIRHYLLLPTYEWGVADFHLEVIRPFVKKYQPTVGFSLKEAALAERVTVIGGTDTFQEETLNLLREAGCQVERIEGDGTSIATQLAER